MPAYPINMGVAPIPLSGRLLGDDSLTEHAIDRDDRPPLLPVEIVLAPDWWHAHAGIDSTRTSLSIRAAESRPSRNRSGWLPNAGDNSARAGTGTGMCPFWERFIWRRDLLLPEMLGCEVEYRADAPPQVRTEGAGAARSGRGGRVQPRPPFAVWSAWPSSLPPTMAMWPAM